MRWKQIGTGVVQATLVKPLGGNRSLMQSSIDAFLEGIVGDSHGGIRRVDAREDVLRKVVGIPKGTQMANLRQFSAISLEELAAIGAAMQTPAHIPYGLLSENLVIAGIPDFSQIPPGCLLTFKSMVDDIGSSSQRAVLAVWGPNHPCRAPHDQIVDFFSPIGSRFQPEEPFGKAALGRRGVVGTIYFPGVIEPGDQVTVWQEGSE